jgi:alcohol dehydrogenase class IV
MRSRVSPRRRCLNSHRRRRRARIPEALPDPDSRDFTWEDGDRLIRFGEPGETEALELLSSRGFGEAVLLTGAREFLPSVAGSLKRRLRVPAGPVPEAAAAVRSQVDGEPLVALGGGRVIDAAKAIAGADGLACAAIPTTLSGAELTPFHRMPAGVEEWKLVRPRLVLAIPSLMASQPMPDLAASAMNALAHAVEALYTPMTSERAQEAALRGAGLIARGLGRDAPERTELALGATYAGYASGIAGIAVHHAVCQTIVREIGTPHAQTNAVMLPHFVRLMAARAPEAITALAAALGPEVTVGELASRSGVTRLRELGVSEDQLGAIADASAKHPAFANAPDPPDREGLLEVLRAAY